jgi:preprotein translocase subunit SecG
MRSEAALSSLSSYLSITLIVVSFVLIGLVMLQARGSGLGAIFGGDGGVYKTRRGMEKTLFNMTILFSTIFLTVSLVTVLVQ